MLCEPSEPQTRFSQPLEHALPQVLKLHKMIDQQGTIRREIGHELKQLGHGAFGFLFAVHLPEGCGP